MNNFKRIMMILSPCAALSSFDAQAVSNMHAQRHDYDKLLESGKNGLVMISMDGCGHCKDATPGFDEISQRPEFKDLEFLKLEKDADGVSEVVDTLDLGGYPAFVCVKEGKVQHTEIGFNKEKLEHLAQSCRPSAGMSENVDAMSPVAMSPMQEAPMHEEGIFDKLKGLFVGLFETIKNIFVAIFDWIKGLFNR